MEITEQIKFLVISPYCHQLVVGNEYDKTQLSLLRPEDVSLIGHSSTHILKLRSLSNITILDCIQLLRVTFPDDKTKDVFYNEGVITYYIKLKYSWSKRTMVLLKESITLFQQQYLISKGYDLPHYLLDGKTLFESGLTIYQ